MANNPGGPGKPIYIGKRPKPRPGRPKPRPGDKLNLLPTVPGNKPKPMPAKPARPGDKLNTRPIVGKPRSEQERQKKLKTLEEQMKKSKPLPKKSKQGSTELYPVTAAKGIVKVGKDTASYYANKLTPKDKKQIVKGGPRPKMKRMAQQRKGTR